MLNNGIQINGGALTAKQIVVGENARAYLHENTSVVDLESALARLESAILTSNLSIACVRNLQDATASIKAEVAKPNPVKSKIDKYLQLIEKSAGSVSAIGTALKVLIELVA